MLVIVGEQGRVESPPDALDLAPALTLGYRVFRLMRLLRRLWTRHQQLTGTTVHAAVALGGEQP